ncbi:unnamed protein product [Sphenostylis stenocarpa]|uniref:Pectinesterase inhibitor domain-containing protein n=1 Tax=Sphenostylis stenocarpa TaxID=92480 RepID=A0AA86SXP3_9FABA|nr:unnamed protein product [Sphenostylis stenocarpa]
MKTDPQNSDYIVEFDATRNFEPWRVEYEETDKMNQKRNFEEMGDVMKLLENRTGDSKREMDILAALDEMKSMKSRHTVSVDEMLEALQHTAVHKEKRLVEEDETLIKSVVFHNSGGYVKRIRDEDIETDEQLDDLSNGHGETFYYNAKKQKQKISEDHPSKSTNTLTKASLDDSGKQANARISGKLDSLVKDFSKNFAVADYKLIQTLCHNSETPETCMKCVESSKGAVKADGVGIARIVVNCMKDEAKTLSHSITKLASTSHGKLKSVCKRCAKEYGYHIGKKEFVTIHHALKHHKYDHAELFVARALSVDVACRSDLHHYHDKVPSDVFNNMKVFEELSEAACRIMEKLY